MAIMTKKERRVQRKARIRALVSGTKERPRVAIFRSNRNFSAQVIDDTVGITLTAVSTNESEFGGKGDIEKIAATLVARAKKAGISAVVFDRGGYRYTGKIARFADALRSGGLTF